MGDLTGLPAIVEALQARTEAKLRERAKAAGITPDEQEALDRAEYDRKRREYELEAERKQRAGALEFSRAPVGPRERDAIIARKFEQTKAVQLCTKFVAQDTFRFLVLCGPNGVGKTFAAACAVASVGRGIFVRSRRLPEAMRPWRGENERTFDARLEPMIVLEELGTEDPSNERWRDAWFEFVDDRQARGHTIITTNLTKPEVEARFGHRIRDRLESTWHVHQLTGGSMRTKLRVVK